MEQGTWRTSYLVVFVGCDICSCAVELGALNSPVSPSSVHKFSSELCHFRELSFNLWLCPLQLIASQHLRNTSGALNMWLSAFIEHFNYIYCFSNYFLIQLLRLYRQYEITAAVSM